jgi:NAD(P)-dependent dehydrogenase (short-subunit alcohol dehydrogenase family)
MRRTVRAILCSMAGPKVALVTGTSNGIAPHTAVGLARSGLRVIATMRGAATTGSPKFRWRTSPGAAAFVGLSLADLDGSRVLGATSTRVD